MRTGCISTLFATIAFIRPCRFDQTLRCCSIVMHIHDEVVIEADRRMSLQAVCDQMGRTPPWAKGLQLRADGYETDFYKKD